MPLTGELEHLPVVDVIQLIHSTRKSGTLNVYSRKGEGQLVFNAGYIVGATHSSEKLRIGQILCEGKIITPADLEKALKIQEKAQSKRKPLIATLFEHCGLSKESAFKALETLIEMTIVEMISWTKGIFSLEMDKIHISDEYRYLPTQLQELNLDTQMVLLDALRIFDEKVHAGEITIDEHPNLSESTDDIDESEEEKDEIIVSEDILGLADIDKIEKKKPHVFKSLEVFEPSEMHRQIISLNLSELSDGEQTKVAELLVKTAIHATDDSHPYTANPLAVIMYCDDKFVQHATMTLCQKNGLLFFSAADLGQLNELVEQSLDRNFEPILIFDSTITTMELFLSSISLEIKHILQTIEFCPTPSDSKLGVPEQTVNKNQKAVFTKPVLSDNHDLYIDDLTVFLNDFQSYLSALTKAVRRLDFSHLQQSIAQLEKLNKAPEISLKTLEYISEMFERSLTLIVNKSELIAERSFGLVNDKKLGVSTAQKFKFPIADDSIFQRVIVSGNILFDSVRDGALEEHLFHEMGAPLESAILIAPLKANGRTITLTYADFGNERSRPIPIDMINYFIKQAGIAMGNALFRKPTKPQE